MVCANSILETIELRICITDNHLNPYFTALIKLMKKSEEQVKTTTRYYQDGG